MEIQKDYSCLEQMGEVVTKMIDLDLDYQESLPAYCDDLYRIVKCLCHSYITSADINYNEIKLYGKTEICLTYYNENSELSYVDFEEEFNKCITLEQLSDKAFVCFDICNKYSNYRVINQRRLDVHTAIQIKLHVYDEVNHPYISRCSDAKLRQKSVDTVAVVTSNIAKIDFDETFSVPADSPEIKRVISFFALPFITDTKVIQNKALVRGKVNLNVLYTGEDNALYKTAYLFNFSKIIEIPSLAEDDILLSHPFIGSLFLKVKGSGEKMNQLSAYGEIIVYSTVLRESNTDIITDGYLLNRESDCSFSTVRFLERGQHINEVRQSDVTFRLTDDVSEIKELSFDIGTPTVRGDVIAATVTANAVCAMNGEELMLVSSQQELQLPMNGFSEAFVVFSIKDFDYTIGDDGALNVRFMLAVNAYFCSLSEARILSDIDGGTINSNRPPLTLYFGSEKEDVWDIAKTFSSDAARIMDENNLSGEQLQENRILIIPGR